MPAHPAPDTPSRAALAARLGALRVATGLTGNAFAKRMGIVQSRVWKIEHRELTPTEGDIRAWVTAAGEPEEVARELINLLGESRSEHQNWREAYSQAGGAAALQRMYREAEDRVTLIREFQIAFIPGLLQTRQYAREVSKLPYGPLAWDASEREVEGLVDERMRRQQVLLDPGKRVQVVLAEGALRTLMTTPATLIEQLQKLEMIASLPNVELGIIGFHQRMPVYPFTAFVTLDDAVSIEHLADDLDIKGADNTATFIGAFDLLREAASHGDDAITLIEQAIRDLEQGA